MVALALVTLALCACFVPMLLLRHQPRKLAHDYFVVSHLLPPAVLRNSLLGYTLRVASLGSLVAWGASGDPWPAVVASLSLGLGMCLLSVLRGPVLGHIDRALDDNSSITVHAFIARLHGGDARVRVLAASLTIAALLGLIVVEAFAAATLLQPMMGSERDFTLLLAPALMLLAAIYAVPSGHSGVLHAVQMQFGIVCLGLLGTMALLLYLAVSALSAMPPHAALAVASAAVLCTFFVLQRRSKFIDTSPMGVTQDGELAASRWLRKLQKILNVCVSAFAILIVVLALMYFYAAGPPALARDSFAALKSATPPAGLAALALLLLFYPLVDVSTWQRLAAAARDGQVHNIQPNERATGLRKLLQACAIDGALIWLLLWMLGTIASVAIGLPGGADSLPDLVRALASAQDEITDAALALLLIALVTMTISVMSSMLAAGLCTIRYDIVPAIWPEMAAEATPAAAEPLALRRTIAIAATAGLLVALPACAAYVISPMIFNSTALVAAVLGLCCAQLCFVPLIVGPTVGLGRNASTVSAGWALAILAVGAGGGVGAIALYLATDFEPWLWTSIPACIGLGVALLMVARLTTADLPR